MKAILKNYRQAPRKVALISELIRGKSVAEARNILTRLVKRGSLPMLKLLDSAVANAKENNKISNPEKLIISSYVNEGAVLKRWRPRAMGRAFPIRKKTAHIVIKLSEKNK